METPQPLDPKAIVTAYKRYFFDRNPYFCPEMPVTLAKRLERYNRKSSTKTPLAIEDALVFSELGNLLLTRDRIVIFGLLRTVCVLLDDVQSITYTSTYTSEGYILINDHRVRVNYADENVFLMTNMLKEVSPHLSAEARGIRERWEPKYAGLMNHLDQTSTPICFFVVSCFWDDFSIKMPAVCLACGTCEGTELQAAKAETPPGTLGTRYSVALAYHLCDLCAKVHYHKKPLRLSLGIMPDGSGAVYLAVDNGKVFDLVKSLNNGYRIYDGKTVYDNLEGTGYWICIPGTKGIVQCFRDSIQFWRYVQAN
jgi:hypothetical protein